MLIQAFYREVMQLRRLWPALHLVSFVQSKIQESTDTIAWILGCQCSSGVAKYAVTV
jgi:hypothetical protein